MHECTTFRNGLRDWENPISKTWFHHVFIPFEKDLACGRIARPSKFHSKLQLHQTNDAHMTIAWIPFLLPATDLRMASVDPPEFGDHIGVE